MLKLKCDKAWYGSYYIYANDFTIPKLDKKSINKSDPEDLVKLLIFYVATDRKLLDRLENIISKYAKTSCYYACFCLHGRFKIGEKAILTSPHFSYCYAKYALKRRWKKAEYIISTNICESFDYIHDMIKGPFPLMEKILLQADSHNDMVDLVNYCKLYKGRWKEAEPIISKDGYLSTVYAIEVLKDRFPLGEYSIIHKSGYSNIMYYFKQCVKKRWKEAEPKLAEDLNSAYEYAVIIQDRFKLAEPIFKKYPEWQKIYNKFVKSLKHK